MAAGIGSRFGTGIKQLEPVDDANHIIMDYSIHDAIEAGFNHVVFIIRKDIEKEFKEAIGNRIAAICSSHVNAPYQVPYKLKAASAALLHCFFGFLTTSGNFSDHGSRSSKNDRSLSSMCLGISVRRCSKYSYGFRLFAFAVSAML